MKNLIQFDKKVYSAIKSKRPVIALESTLISHGLPYPTNISVAKSLEQIAVENGVTPATIFIGNGKIHIGITDEELSLIGKGGNIHKVSKMNLSEVLASGEYGATTVSGTMLASSMAGIDVFATGGIGGVHFFQNEAMDISRDLEELAALPMIVVSAGAKSILDIKNTIEYLETKGVSVFGYKTSEFPAFYKRSSGIKVRSVESAQDIAAIYRIQRRLKINSSILIGNPIPKEHEIRMEIDSKIQDALSECKEKKISGQKVTPFLLSKLTTITGGESEKANIKLLENNVKLACEIAKELAK